MCILLPFVIAFVQEKPPALKARDRGSNNVHNRTDNEGLFGEQKGEFFCCAYSSVFPDSTT